jgi:hypothetical protein
LVNNHAPRPFVISLLPLLSSVGIQPEYGMRCCGCAMLVADSAEEAGVNPDSVPATEDGKGEQKAAKSAKKKKEG